MKKNYIKNYLNNISVYFAVLLFVLSTSLYSKEEFKTKSFDCLLELRFCIGQDISELQCSLSRMKGIKNSYTLLQKYVFMGSDVEHSSIEVENGVVATVTFQLSGKSISDVEKNLTKICSHIVEKRINKTVTERTFYFVNGYRINTSTKKNHLQVKIFMREMNSLVSNGAVDALSFFGFDIGEKTTMMQGYDVRGPNARMSFRPTAKIFSVQMYSTFVKVENGKIESIHFLTNPTNKIESEQVQQYLQKQAVSVVHSKEQKGNRIYNFKNGYTIDVEKEGEILCHFVIKKNTKFQK